MGKTYSLKTNALLNVIKSSLSILFPLITYPYVLRALGAQGMGKVSYVASIVGYFTLIATLGIGTYGVREGAKIREKKEELQQFVNEIFSINTISLFVSVTAYLIVIFSVKRFYEYRILFFIQGLSIIFQVISMDWINQIFEDYYFITVRSLFSYAITLLLIFSLIRNEADYIYYAAIQVIPLIIICISNRIHCTQYVRPRFTVRLNVKRHIKPVLYLFANALMVSVYVNFDTTMLGWMKGDYYVGEYTLAAKIYSIVKTVLIAIYAVAIPRLASYVGKQDWDNYKKTNTQLWGWIEIIVCPIVAGLICLSEEIIQVMGGKEYAEATGALVILSIALLFAIFGGLLTSCLNVTIGREKNNLIITCISACANIILNLFFISRYNHIGAAITTLISEAIVVVYSLLTLPQIQKYMDGKAVWKNFFHAGVGSSIVAGYIWLIRRLLQGAIAKISLSVLGAVVVYSIILWVVHNEIFCVIVARAKETKIGKFLSGREIRFQYFAKVRLLDWMPDSLFLKCQYKAKTGKELDFRNPIDYNQKIQWYKVFYREPIMTQCADKITVRDYVRDCGFEKYLTPLYAIYASFEDISYDELPNCFFLKCNNSSGYNAVIRQDELEKDRKFQLAKEMRRGLSKRAYMLNREWAYKDIIPQLLCEEYLQPNDGNPLVDFNFFCFSGKIKMIYMNVGMADNEGHHNSIAKRAVFDEELHHVQDAITQMEQLDPKYAKLPIGIKEIIQAAEKLSQPFPHARVDFMYVNGKFYFGEITFYSASGYLYLEPQSLYDMLGESFDITKIRQE